MASTVLLVDDDPTLTGLLGSLLRDAGYEVIQAAHGEAALVELESHPVDVAIIDMRLPGETGLDLCREISRRGGTRIVALSAATGSHDVVAFLDAGADDYVTKPVHGQVLAARLRAVMRRPSRQL